MGHARNSAAPASASAGAKPGPLFLPAGTECEKNSGPSLIIPEENPPSPGTIAPLMVMHASDDKPSP